MKASVYHLQINVTTPSAIHFYKELLQYFEYRIIDEDEEYLGMTNGTVDFWIMKTARLLILNLIIIKPWFLKPAARNCLTGN